MAEDKYVVYGEYGDTFSRLVDARRCAKEVSKICGESSVWLIADGCNYIDYVNGKVVRDGWKVSKKSA